MNSSTEESADKEKRTGFEQDLEHLRNIPLFQGLDYECLKLMALLCKTVNFVEGDQLMVQGEDDASAYYLLTGHLQSFHTKESVIYPIEHYEPGQFIGGLALVGTTIRLFTLQAAEKSTVLRLSRKSFLKVMEQFPGSMMKIAANITAELTLREQEYLSQLEPKDLESGDQPLGISLL